MVCAEAEAPKRPSPEGQDKPTKRLREKTRLGTKRGAEEPLEKLEHPHDDQGDTQMNLMETLMMESKATEMTSKEDEEEQIQLESGWQWAPRSWVTKGDVKGMQGLVDKGCLKFVASVPDGAKAISSKVVRTFKGDGVKSRLVLRDIAHGKPKPAGGELYATTPSVAAIRTVTAIAATWRVSGRKKGESHGVIIGDVSQAFIHATIDQQIFTRVPETLERSCNQDRRHRAHTTCRIMDRASDGAVRLPQGTTLVAGLLCRMR